MDQWRMFRSTIPNIGEMFQKLWWRVLKRAAGAPNGQTGCERDNSIYNQFKTKTCVRMALPIVCARLRIKQNGPPQSKFKPTPVRKLWIEKGHQYAETATKKKVVIERIRKDAEQEYNSRIFD